MFTRGKKIDVEQKPIEESFTGFNIFEYNLFWILHFLIILSTIYFIEGNVIDSVGKFLKLINPLNWL